MNALFVLMIILFVVGILGYLASKKQKEQKIILEKRTKELGIENKFDAGKYLSGHPKIITPKIDVNIFFKDDNIHIISKTNDLVEYGLIPLKEVTNVLVEDASTIEKRITATRLLAVGLFAFAAKKKEINELYYLTINWKDGKFDQETIFEFSIVPWLAKNLQNPLQSANLLKSEIMNKANALIVE